MDPREKRILELLNENIELRQELIARPRLWQPIEPLLQAAFRAGAEYMRELAAKECNDMAVFAEAIRVLPLDKP
jgi:hypothetical protein